jgi:cytochrome c oxidase assembly protein subunit 15
VLPADSAESVIEFTHRLAATVVAVLIALCAWRAYRNLRDRRFLVRGSVAAGVLVLAQAALGGLTVEQGLEDELVAAHLGLAMLLLGLLFLLRRWSDESAPAPPPALRGVRTLGVVTSALVLATIVAGGLVAGTEGEGTPSEPVLGAHTACGEQFPTCLNRFMPFDEGRLVDIQLTHRLFMYLAAIAVVAMTAVALRQGVRQRAFWVASLLLVGQVLLGALNVWLGEHAGLIAAHLTLGTLLWATVITAASSLLPASAPARAEAAGAQTTSPVTA